MNPDIINHLTKRYPVLGKLETRISEAALAIITCFENNHKLLICGNGGSCSDSEHIAGELAKSFELTRQLDNKLKERIIKTSETRGPQLAAMLQAGLPAISLNSNGALISAISNDIGADAVYAQQVIALGNPGDVLLVISTSGNSPNVIDAAIAAKAAGLVIIALTGRSGGKLKQYCDILLNVPEKECAKVQELHRPVYHTICRLIEAYFFLPGNNPA